MPSLSLSFALTPRAADQHCCNNARTMIPRAVKLDDRELGARKDGEFECRIYGGDDDHDSADAATKKTQPKKARPPWEGGGA
ncbi:hypothetical protein EDC01DRAFT_775696 [Geopyxis carbonaria]|nr:hypothetical protein EDC01DRAFT_775696 [Geopyxis carbonaria]